MAVNGLYIVQGEANAVVAHLKKSNTRWSHQSQIHLNHSSLDETDPLLRNFTDLRDVLNSVNDLCDMNPDTFLSPFLDVIRSAQTNGPVTAQALSSVAKFLSYGLIDSLSIKASHSVENIAEAVTHAKFVGSADGSNDEVVLLKILQVLRTLLLTPVGRLLSNESVCEMMQSCFRICFESCLSELLRTIAESTLADMTQLLFTRLPTFDEDKRHPYIRKLVKRASNAKRRRRETLTVKIRTKECARPTENTHSETAPCKEAMASSSADIPDVLSVTKDGYLQQTEEEKMECISSHAVITFDNNISADAVEDTGDQNCDIPCDPCDANSDTHRACADKARSSTLEKADELNDDATPRKDESSNSGNEMNYGSSIAQRQRMNDRGVRFTPEHDRDDPSLHRKLLESALSTVVKPASHILYGLPCVRELLRFLIALTSPIDRANTESMIAMGLNLLTVALEAGADHLHNYNFLIPLVKNELCRALLHLLDTEKLPIFAATNRVCFLLFESLRSPLKFQMEAYFLKLKSIVTSDQSRISYEQKEMALESIVELWRIPGLVTELYLNYDCDLYCSNLFEDLIKLLLENAFPLVGLRSIHFLSLDALLTVIDTIDINCVYRQCGDVTKAPSYEQLSSQLNLPVISGLSFARQLDSNIPEKVMPVSPQKDINTNNSCTHTAIGGSLILSSAVRANRMPPSGNIPSLSEVLERKKRKRLLTEATDFFNQNPRKGIEFLRDRGIFKVPLSPKDIVEWLRENPRLDKKRIADYICNRKNSDVLEAFVASFPFGNTRLDEALRMFLETFRLPGEAAEISMVMQHFSDSWYEANNQPFNHVDAAFTLSYAIIMLNTDQHNPQVRRNQPPMQLECFKRNLSGTNGGQDFDPELLEQMFNSIRCEEIIMPAEQVGLVKGNYLWKVLLRRGETKEGEFIHIPAGWNDQDLFSIIWGPASAALSFVFDKTDRESILQKALNGYRKCASIAAHYGMSDVFDNLIIHLCKFSTLMTLTEGTNEGGNGAQASDEKQFMNPEYVAIVFGENVKAQMAARTMFQLIHSHGDILREGWKNVLDCIICLFRAQLLPKTLTEVEDFVDSKGWVSIQRNHYKKLPPTKNESGLLSWFGLGSSSHDAKDQKPSFDQQNAIKVARATINDCNPQQIISDSKYLTSSALTELINSIIQASSSFVPHPNRPSRSAKQLNEMNEDALVLHLEIAVSITVENKDRLSQIWKLIHRHLQWLMTSFGRNPLIVERAVVGLLRLVNRNLFRLKEDIADEVLQSLNLLLCLPPPAMFMFSRHIAYGLHEVLRVNAANIHSREHWALIFRLIAAAGAGTFPEDAYESNIIERIDIDAVGRCAYSDTEPSNRSISLQEIQPTSCVDERGYTSDDPHTHLDHITSIGGIDSATSLNKTSSSEWIHLDHKDVAQQHLLRQLRQEKSPITSGSTLGRGTIVLRSDLARHEPAAFLKVGETLAFLARDAAHVTPENFDSCVDCIRSYVEAGLDGGRYAAGPLSGDAQNRLRSVSDDRSVELGSQANFKARTKISLSSAMNSEEDPVLAAKEPSQQLSTSYQQVSLQMLDICYTLHIKVASIYKIWAGDGSEIDASPSSLWYQCWRSILQCIARLCCDCRRQIRMQALNYLVRSFLIPEMQEMGAIEWENCFSEVLFPLANKLLDNLSPMDPLGMEETRVRAMQLISKIFLNHLIPLSSQSSFPTLWLRLLDFMDRYLHTDRSDLLSEAIPESLKNMILVLDNTKLFKNIPGLHEMTTSRVEKLLPYLMLEVMPGPPLQQCKQNQSSEGIVSAASKSANFSESFGTAFEERNLICSDQTSVEASPIHCNRTADPGDLSFARVAPGHKDSLDSSMNEANVGDVELEEIVVHPHLADERQTQIEEDAIHKAGVNDNKSGITVGQSSWELSSSTSKPLHSSGSTNLYSSTEEHFGHSGGAKACESRLKSEL